MQSFIFFAFVLQNLFQKMYIYINEVIDLFKPRHKPARKKKKFVHTSKPNLK